MHVDKDGILGVDFTRLVKQSSPGEVSLTAFMIPPCREEQNVVQRTLGQIEDDLGRLRQINMSDKA